MCGANRRPDDSVRLAETGESIHAIMQSPTERSVAELDAIHRDDGEFLGQAAVLRQVEQRRDQFAPGQIARAAEDDEDGGLELVGRF